MSDNGQSQDQQPEGGSPSAGTQNTEHMIPKSRLDEVIQRAAAAEAALKDYQERQAAAEQERLKKQGEWQQIAENAQKEAEALKTFKQRTESLEKMLQDGNQARIARVPEARRGLIPVDYPPERLSVWLDTNWELLHATPAPSTDAGATSSGGGISNTAKLNEAEVAAAKKLGLTSEQYAKYKSGG